MKATGDQQLVKRINRSVLLRLLRAQPGLSRARLAQQSGLTKSTVSALVRELLDEHWLSEPSAPVASDGMGRPSTPLVLDADTRLLLGLEIGVRQLRLVTVSLNGTLLSSLQRPLASTDARAVCAQAVQLVYQAWQTAQQHGRWLSGIGVCLPGAVDARSGLVRFAPNLGWRDLGFLAMLTRALAAAAVPDVALHLHNDADAAALGEYEFGTNGNTDPLIFVNCDVGVGAGIVLHDRLFTGAHGMAGEVGHSVLQVDGALCSCGRRGCAETLIGAQALSGLHGIERGAQALGLLIQNLDAMFNPTTVVVGGSSCSAYPTLLKRAALVVRGYAQMAGVPPPGIRAARYGLNAAAVGAAAVAWHRYLRPTHLHAGPAPDAGHADATRNAPVGAELAGTETPLEVEGST